MTYILVKAILNFLKYILVKAILFFKEWFSWSLFTSFVTSLIWKKFITKMIPIPMAEGKDSWIFDWGEFSQIRLKGWFKNSASGILSKAR